MPTSDWLANNRQALIQRLAWIRDKPNGVVCETPSTNHQIVIHRQDEALRMCFVDPQGAREELNWSGAMSALRLDDPFDLSPTPYNQAFMLVLLWQSAPRRVYVAGFAGGRIPLVFYHYFPEVIIDSTDVDGAIVSLASTYFGIDFDDRQRLFITDGREFLESSKVSLQYDFILLDAFCAKGVCPQHLSTIEFFQLCKKHLKPGGVVAANLVECDPLFGSRIATVASSFRHVYIQSDRTSVIFATDGPPLGLDDVAGRAEALQREHRFSFDLIKKAATLKPLREVTRLQRSFEEGPVLTDV